MLVSHRYKFIYTKTAKTASTSVEEFFEPFCKHVGEEVIERPYESTAGIIGLRMAYAKDQNAKWWNHMPAATIKEQLGQEVWDSYFKFCTIRNPFEKCVSVFEHLAKKRPVRRPALRSTLQRLHLSAEQRRFLNYLEQRPPIDRNKYVIDGAFCLDDVIRYETLEADVARICTRLGVPFDRPIPRRKTKFRRPEATVQRLFSLEARELVEELFAFELDYFGYSFPEENME